MHLSKAENNGTKLKVERMKLHKQKKNEDRGRKTETRKTKRGYVIRLNNERII